MSSLDPPSVAMDVDTPASGPGTLKRCSSAPMINDTNTIMTTANPSTSTARDQQTFNIFGSSTPRPRRFSASSSPAPGSPQGSLRLTPRINQLRQEEHADISNMRELANEREVNHAMQISQSWEDLCLLGESPDPKQNKMGPIHVSLPSYTGMLTCNSPSNSSPTRLNSPGLGFQSPTRATKTFTRRSASPVLRPSPLGVKRKLEDDKSDYLVSPRVKRVSSYSAVDRGGLLTTTANSLPGSLSSVGTPESLSSADSPGFNFINVDSPSPNRNMNSEPMIVAKNDHDMTESPS